MKRMMKKGIPRLLMVAVVVAASVLVSQCQIDKLLSTPSGGVLVVNPPLLADSAPLGSSAARIQKFVVGNAASGRLSWTAATSRNSPWLKLSAASGTTPDTVPVRFLPATLAIGVYRDTVVVTGTGSSAGELRIPVQFTVQSCGVTSIAVGAPATGTLGAASCTAPHRAGHPAQLFSVNGSAGDSITIELTTPYPGYVIFDSALAPAVPSFAESGTCQGVAGNPCIYYQRLPRTGAYTVEVTTANVGDSGAFSLLLSPPRIPNAADTLAQLLGDSVTVLPTGATTTQPAVVVRAHVSDPDAPDSLQLEVEVKPTSVAFTGTGTVLGSPVANGQRAYVRLTGLADDSSLPLARAGGGSDGSSGPLDLVRRQCRIRDRLPRRGSATTRAARRLGQFRDRQRDGDRGRRTSRIPPLRGQGHRLGSRSRRPDPSRSRDPADRHAVHQRGDRFRRARRQRRRRRRACQLRPLDGTSYHWQARAVDQTGLVSGWVSFGANVESAPDFTVHIAHPPAAPDGSGAVQEQRHDGHCGRRAPPINRRWCSRAP